MDEGLVYGLLVGVVVTVFPSLVFYVLKAFRAFIDKLI